MAIYVGVDFHPRSQTICWCDTADGVIHQGTLDHGRDDVRGFYAQFVAPAVVGLESSGYALWFHHLVEEMGHELRVGDAFAIRQFARRPRRTIGETLNYYSICCCAEIFRPSMYPVRRAGMCSVCCAIGTGWCACARC